MRSATSLVVASWLLATTNAIPNPLRLRPRATETTAATTATTSVAETASASPTTTASETTTAPETTTASASDASGDAPESTSTSTSASEATNTKSVEGALAPWVTVDDDGKAHTITPISTTVSGTPTILSAAPHDLTATVFTYTSNGGVYTSTGSAPPAPAATGKNDAGSYNVCQNKDGEFAPWCKPDGKDPLYIGTTYYFTWDPDYFGGRNSTVQVVGNWINSTTGEERTESPALMSVFTPAAAGYTSILMEDKVLLHQGSQNISIKLVASVEGKHQERPGPQIHITTRPGPVADAHGKLAPGTVLSIALPIVFGFIIAVVAGTCIWNRHHRRIELKTGSAMGRNYDVTKKSRFGFGKRNKAAKATERIQLMEREVQADGGEVYHDLPAERPSRPRRDSDALDSLAGTPTEERPPASGNAFRDELRRQDNARQ
ncbi:hypothetical protein F4808DRAFT_341203 [Astrocystis sublimbata]|nr:hypothetical protein F4808DRAFT_341203 [Astrocystis sublimbata]